MPQNEFSWEYFKADSFLVDSFEMQCQIVYNLYKNILKMLR